MNQVMQWFFSSEEYRTFGFNITTISVLGTFFFTIVQGWSISNQSRQIWESRSSKGVETLLFVYTFFYFLSFLYYGISTYRLAPTFNGLLGFLHIPLLAGIWKFNIVRMWQIVGVAIFGIAMLSGMAISDDKDIVLMIYLFGILIFLVRQAWKVWISDDMGELNLQFVLGFFITCAFWIVYAFAVDSWPLEVFNILAVIAYICMLKPWLRRQLDFFKLRLAMMKS